MTREDPVDASVTVARSSLGDSPSFRFPGVVGLLVQGKSSCVIHLLSTVSYPPPTCPQRRLLQLAISSSWLEFSSPLSTCFRMPANFLSAPLLCYKLLEIR